MASFTKFILFFSGVSSSVSGSTPGGELTAGDIRSLLG
jgi:hypothetical protein